MGDLLINTFIWEENTPFREFVVFHSLFNSYMYPIFSISWYHGSISRECAETLLTVQKEGSYLVRVSDSNRMDYSLSLK